MYDSAVGLWLRAALRLNVFLPFMIQSKAHAHFVHNNFALAVVIRMRHLKVLLADGVRTGYFEKT